MQNVVATSNAEAKYSTMTSASCELMWLKQMLKELRYGKVTQMSLISDLLLIACIKYFALCD